MKVFNRVILAGLFVCFGFFTEVKAQQMNGQNIASIRVDELSDDQVRQFIKQMEGSGMTDAQLEQMAVAKGMSVSEMQKLKMRIAALKGKGMVGADKAPIQEGRKLNFAMDNDSSSFKQRKEVDPFENLKPKIFGADLFNNKNLTFEPNLRMATPLNYQLGPDDQLVINVYGKSLVDWNLRVSPEGNINIPTVGFVSVNGLTIEQATSRIKAKLASNNYSVGSGTTVQVSLGNIRSIKVILTGAVVKPGTYTLPSVATAINALTSSGGPGENGSFRQIEIIRNNKVIRKLDVYNYLKGNQSDNIRLQDQDIIRIPTYKVRVELSGEVKEPALFEVVPGESLKQVIDFAGGFTDLAYTAKIKVLELTSKEKRIADINESDLAAYIPKRGDKYIIDRILDRYQNRVVLNGAVFRPGQYQLENGLTLSALIKKADGLKEDAFSSRGYIIRLKADNTTEMVSFDVKKTVSGEVPDVVLQREDEIFIPSIFDLREGYKVNIQGEIRKPGEFPYAEKMTLQDLIVQAGGFAEGASTQRIEIARRVKDADAKSINSKVANIIQVDVDRNLSLEASKTILEPFDIVIVRSAPGYEKQKMVKIEGEVIYPGFYTIQSKSERLSDLLRRAGGLTAWGDIEGGSLKRPGPDKNNDKNAIDRAELEKEKFDKITKLQVNGAKDTVNVEKQKLQFANENVGIDLKKAIAKPGSKADLILEDGDIIRVPKQLQIVKVSGEVLYPNSVVFSKGKSLSDYIDNAGGFSVNALKGRSYVIYPNGSVKSTKSFFFFNNYPMVKPGSEIIIPKKGERKKLSAQELIGISSGVASLGAIILGIINLSK